MIEGYVFQEAEGEFLIENGVTWYPHKKPEDAFVHPKSLLEKLRATWEVSDELEIKPSKVYPATYSPETSVVITGEPFDF